MLMQGLLTMFLHNCIVRYLAILIAYKNTGVTHNYQEQLPKLFSTFRGILKLYVVSEVCDTFITIADQILLS